jgi:hypothetical protein
MEVDETANKRKAEHRRARSSSLFVGERSGVKTQKSLAIAARMLITAQRFEKQIGDAVAPRSSVLTSESVASARASEFADSTSDSSSHAVDGTQVVHPQSMHLPGIVSKMERCTATSSDIITVEDISPSEPATHRLFRKTQPQADIVGARTSEGKDIANNDGKERVSSVALLATLLQRMDHMNAEMKELRSQQNDILALLKPEYLVASYSLK